MHKNFEINRTKIKGGCQSGRKVVTKNFKSDLPLASLQFSEFKYYSNALYSFVTNHQTGGIMTTLKKFLPFIDVTSVQEPALRSVDSIVLSNRNWQGTKRNTLSRYTKK